MVAAKLDQSRVLVTTFRQNRLTLKGRSAGQRHTHTRSSRQTRLTIMALQVCNRANTKYEFYGAALYASEMYMLPNIRPENA